jgi:hypothetical protein
MAPFFRTLVLPDEVERWSLTTLREKVVKIGANSPFGKGVRVGLTRSERLW